MTERQNIEWKEIWKDDYLAWICGFANAQGGKLYIGMEFLAGGPLFYHLQQCHRFSEERARFYVAEVIVGIGHLHEHNILYRDMKPENILLDRDGHIVITDFGLSKLTSNYDATAQTICGIRDLKDIL